MYASFRQYFPETAVSETCQMSIRPGNHFGLPVGEYAFIEMYCDDPDCDCRRVRLAVARMGDSEPLGVVDYGWETPAFYNRLLVVGKKAEAKMLAGITVAPSIPSLKHETAIRALVAEWVEIPHILDHIKRHYQMVRDHVDGVHPSTERRKLVKKPTSRRTPKSSGKESRQGKMLIPLKTPDTDADQSTMPEPIVMGPLATRVRRAMIREIQKRSGLSIPKEVLSVASKHLFSEPKPAPAGVSSWDAYVHGLRRSAEFSQMMRDFPALMRYAKIVNDAMIHYRLGPPSLIPTADSVFGIWATCDLPIDDSGECLVDCMLALPDIFEYTTQDCEVFRNMKSGRMGIYEHMGSNRGLIRLRELLTDQDCECRSMSKYPGTKGELWFVRLVPPLSESHESEYFTLTPPYILTDATKSDWEDYLRRVMPHARLIADQPPLHCLLKYGLVNAPFHWHDFIRNAYSSHIREATYLTGLPDLHDSMPHQSDRIFRK